MSVEGHDAVGSFLSQTHGGDCVTSVTWATGECRRASVWPRGTPSKMPAEGPSPDRGHLGAGRGFRRRERQPEAPGTPASARVALWSAGPSCARDTRRLPALCSAPCQGDVSLQACCAPRLCPRTPHSRGCRNHARLCQAWCRGCGLGMADHPGLPGTLCVLALATLCLGKALIPRKPRDHPPSFS